MSANGFFDEPTWSATLLGSSGVQINVRNAVAKAGDTRKSPRPFALSSAARSPSTSDCQSTCFDSYIRNWLSGFSVTAISRESQETLALSQYVSDLSRMRRRLKSQRRRTKGPLVTTLGGRVYSAA